MSSNDVTATLGIGRAVTAAPAEADRAKIRELAAQFESMLMAQMLREMKQAMTPDAENQGLGGQMMGDTITTELAMALGRSGALGLSELVGAALARLDGDASVGGPAGPATDATAAPPAFVPVAPALAPTLAPVAGVTSPYGWRADPIHGQHRFHAGLDLRAAYGQDVHAATDGVVKFAGEQPGYGLVVVVSHDSGLETRYAHLSATEVAQGQPVRAGDLIARSGNSGRSTGAHLHFEVRHHGRPVDPGQVSGLAPVVGRLGTASD